MAVAEASLSTVNVSISLGLIVDNGFAKPDIPELLTGKPSMMIKGSLLADMDEPPLILIVDPLPGAPPEEVITVPALLPTIRSCAEVIPPLLKSLELTVLTAPVASDFLTVPYPMTTTSSIPCV